jgi:capsid protein
MLWARDVLNKCVPRRQGADFQGLAQRRAAGARERDAAGFLHPARPRHTAGSVLSHQHTESPCLPACAARLPALAI